MSDLCDRLRSQLPLDPAHDDEDEAAVREAVAEIERLRRQCKKMCELWPDPFIPVEVFKDV